MRRMYSKQQLEEIAKYLVEHSELNFLEDIAFTGDVSIGGDASVAGDLPVTGDVSIGGDLSVVDKITGGEIIENMSGYSWTTDSSLPSGFSLLFVGAVKNGNKLTLSAFMSINVASASTGGLLIGSFNIPEVIGQKLVPFQFGEPGTPYLDIKNVAGAYSGADTVNVPCRLVKGTNTRLDFYITKDNIVAETDYFLRYEITFLLGENLIPIEP